MSLSCDCDTGCDQYWEVIKRARKTHTCVECPASIEKGNDYYHITTIFEGIFYHAKLCEKCGDLSASLSELGYCWPYGELHEAHKQYLGLI